MSVPHNKIIANAAKTVLGPLGFKRKGQSRLWLADQGWWLAIVEFQPSSWSKGSYLNVSAHWMWSPTDFSFDFGGRQDGFVQYQSDDQFAGAASDLATTAARKVTELRATISSIDATTDLLVNEVRSLAPRFRGGWMDYNAGIACSLAKRAEDAVHCFNTILSAPWQEESLLRVSAEQMASLIQTPDQARKTVLETMARRRSALGLPEFKILAL